MSRREELIDLLRLHVVGPRDGAAEVASDPPSRQYLMGTLYPQQAGLTEVAENEEEEGSGGGLRDEIADDPVRLANEWLPSSIGLSFFVETSSGVRCSIRGARYETFRDGRSRRWRRIAIASSEEPESYAMVPPKDGRGRTKQMVFGGRGEIQALWRPMGKGYLATITLVNIQRQVDPDKVDPDLCLHQVGFACEATNGTIREYPSMDVLTRDPEEEELRLLYRHAKTYAIGHGCSAGWGSTDTGGVSSVWTELLPSFEVAALTYAGGEDDQILLLRRLADPHLPAETLVFELSEFLGRYRRWIKDLPTLHADIPARLSNARDRLLERLRLTADGIDQGIRLLGSDPEVREAFRLANRAMLMQMRHAQEDAGGRKRERGAAPQTYDYAQLPFRWRPFQLAFQLLTLPSIASTEVVDRAVVDLLWFPTGGGKTEAYLGLTAFQIFLRRFRRGARAGGTAVITRYTLRLLSAQQFQRAAALICACELLRREMGTRLGNEPITIGIWVGDEVVPNRFHKALELFDEVLEADAPSNPFQLEQCPWCGTAIVPARRTDDRSAYGIRAGNNSFGFFCPNPSCAFSETLPVSVIDEDLYQRPPTFLVATVDKFARLAWEEGGGAFFGRGVVDPPSLIIQDELHLLSGPLGTTVGVYENAVISLCEYFGAAPKVIASTATIRRADEQVLSLFGTGVRLFPPPGLRASDSYFSKVDKTRPGRTFVGVMSQSHTISTSIVHLGAALLQGPIELGLSGEELDRYWTLVVYHNSLRELGRTVTLARDDIPARLKVVSRDEAKARKLGDQDVVELTSNVAGKELPSLLARLGRRFNEQDTVGLLATTNMLSVGIDIPRLGLMLVNSQPKSTSEYIQATSRVGRGSTPGLIVTMYAATKPRDRSHYESFLPFHGALYRHVEPTSVTPYSVPSRQRALHAALVILIRHGAGLGANDAAARFRVDDPEVQRCIDLLSRRIRRIDPYEAAAADIQLRKLAERWEGWAQKSHAAGRLLYYNASGTRQHDALLADFGSDNDGWETLHSMRNVDRQCTIKVLGA